MRCSAKKAWSNDERRSQSSQHDYTKIENNWRCKFTWSQILNHHKLRCVTLTFFPRCTFNTLRLSPTWIIIIWKRKGSDKWILDNYLHINMKLQMASSMMIWIKRVSLNEYVSFFVQGQWLNMFEIADPIEFLYFL